jgi:hypothetical protein
MIVPRKHGYRKPLPIRADGRGGIAYTGARNEEKRPFDLSWLLMPEMKVKNARPLQ